MFIPHHFAHADVDHFVVMPNHVHGIIVIHHSSETFTPEQFGKPVSASISTIVRSYKSIVTREINKLRQSQGNRVWQSRFHDHIIRSETALNKIREYVLYNPALWEDDTFYEE